MREKSIYEADVHLLGNPNRNPNPTLTLTLIVVTIMVPLPLGLDNSIYEAELHL